MKYTKNNHCHANGNLTSVSDPPETIFPKDLYGNSTSVHLNVVDFQLFTIFLFFA